MYYTWSGWWWFFWVIPMAVILWAILAGSGRRYGRGYWRYGSADRYPYGADLDDDWFPRYRSSRRKYRNRAPLNYQRSDARIQEDVCDRLMMDDDVDPSAMGVQVVNGEVILTGTVSSRFEKRLAEHLADSVPGVTDVDNRLKIGKLEAAPQAPAGNAITGVHA
jgi:hypothetical protein